MVKALSLGSLLVATTMCCIASCAPQATTTTTNGVLRRMRSIASPSPTTLLHQHHYQIAGSGGSGGSGSKLMDEDLANGQNSTARSERSAQLAGVARKIQFYIKNFHLQILPDGTVNGTLDDSSVYTILQRTAIGIGKLKIQGIGTCQYLCMDACGFLYGSRDFNDECVFNEMIQEHHYNTYSSTKYSNDRRTMYLAFNRRGASRKVLLHAGQPLGRLSSYTRVLTRTVSPQKLEELQHPMRHHGHTCPATTEPNPQNNSNPVPRCKRHKKRRKRKRKCPPNADGIEDESDPCHKRQNIGKKTKSSTPNNNSSNSHNISSVSNNRDSNHKTPSISKCESDGSEECQRVDGKKFAKTKHGDKNNNSSSLKKKLSKSGSKSNKKRLKTTQMPLMTTTIVLDESTDETDYLDATTADWDDPTMVPTPEDLTNPHPD